MKKKLFITILIALVSISNSYSQIIQEHSYADSSGLSMIKLENSDYKYLQYDLSNKIVKLYNLDHSIFKIISLPTLLPSTQKLSIRYISENLFNLDNLVEILCSKQQWSPFNTPVDGAVEIIDENGSVIFSQDSMVAVEQRDATYYGYDDKSSFIYNTTSGTKMILYSYKTNDKGFKVFSLPGTLITSIPSVQNENFGQLFPFPNPANTQITIPYELTESSIATLTVYDTKGCELQTMKIDKAFKNVFIDISNLQNGIYLYSIKTETQLIANGRFLVSK